MCTEMSVLAKIDAEMKLIHRQSSYLVFNDKCCIISSVSSRLSKVWACLIGCSQFKIFWIQNIFQNFILKTSSEPHNLGYILNKFNFHVNDKSHWKMFYLSTYWNKKAIFRKIWLNFHTENWVQKIDFCIFQTRRKTLQSSLINKADWFPILGTYSKHSRHRMATC